MTRLRPPGRQARCSPAGCNLLAVGAAQALHQPLPLASGEPRRPRPPSERRAQKAVLAAWRPGGPSSRAPRPVCPLGAYEQKRPKLSRNHVSRGSLPEVTLTSKGDGTLLHGRHCPALGGGLAMVLAQRGPVAALGSRRALPGPSPRLQRGAPRPPLWGSFNKAGRERPRTAG